MQVMSGNNYRASIKVRKDGQQQKTQNELNSDVARFTTHIKPFLARQG